MTRQIWKNKSFNFYLLGQTVSSLGDGFYLVAFMWLALQLSNGKGIVLGGVFSIYTLGEVLFGFIAGPIADRINKKKALIVIDIIRGIIVTLLFIFVRSQMVSIAHLYIFIFAFSFFSPFFHRIEFTIIPQLVEKDLLLSANGILGGSKKLMQIIAPALGGIFVGFFGVASCLLFDAISFFFSAVCIMLISISKATPKKVDINLRNFLSDVRIGYRFLIGSAFLTTLAIYAACINFLGSPIFPLLPLISQRANQGSAGYGMMMSSISIGFIISSFVIGVIGKVIKKIHIVFVGLLLSALSVALFGFTSNAIILLMGSVILGLGMNFSNLPILTLFQEKIPQDRIGVVSSFVFTISQIAMPISMILSGILVDCVDLSYIFAGVSIVLIAGALIGFALPQFRKDEITTVTQMSIPEEVGK
ncbi:MAG: MFS transporter [candidate division WOR-3 bacterium]